MQGIAAGCIYLKKEKRGNSRQDIMNIINNNFFKKVYNKLTGIPYIISYSQTGEDIIIDFLIGAKKIKDFTYLDIGANQPVKFNNTYKFYEKGYKGVCIEPDPHIHAALSKKRPKDICLNIGIAGNASSGTDFYIMDNPRKLLLASS